MPEEEMSQEDYYNFLKKGSIERDISDTITDEQVLMTMVQPATKSSQVVEFNGEGNPELKQLDFMEQFTPDLTTAKLTELEKPMIQGKLALCDVLQFNSEMDKWSLQGSQDMRPAHRFFVRRIAGDLNVTKSASGFMAQLARSKYAFSEGKQEVLQKMQEPEKKKGWGLFGGKK
jgi:hypothetical protein